MMLSINVSFDNAWWLLLLIPAIAITLIPYFRLSKRYRCTRNRITSMVTHTIVMVLAIATLAGILFSYTKPNYKNEIILLVDCSDTGADSTEARDAFVQRVLDDGRYNNFTVGIVTFGFDQVYAVPLTNDIDEIYDQYVDAPKPDTSATDIYAAIVYATEQFTNPQTGKIVLVTDGKETDEKAASAIRIAFAQGIRVDAAHIPSKYLGDDIQVMDIKYPDHHIDAGEECNLTVNIESTVEGSCNLALYDNGVKSETAEMTVNLVSGTNSFTLKHTFKEDGVHDLNVVAEPLATEAVKQNNNHHSYCLIETFNNVLIIEKYEGQSTALKSLLMLDGRYKMDGDDADPIKIMGIDSTDLPKNIEQMLQYDQVILNNVSNEDLKSHEGLDALIETYVHDYGGGLFTVGGNDESGEAHSYNRNDMYGSLYQSMLPVQAVDYTPPVGVVVIIDVSGSMTSGQTPSGGTLVDWALAGAESCLSALTERDYFGILTMSDDYSSVLQLTSCAKKDDIIDTIHNVDKSGGGTKAAPAYRRAVQALVAQQNIEKRHIVLLSDYAIFDDEEFEALVAQHYTTSEVTLSIVGINMSTADEQNAAHTAEVLGHGRLHSMTSDDIEKITHEMREDLMVDSIKEVNFENFKPKVEDLLSPVIKGVTLGTGDENDSLLFELEGFYGVRPRSNAEVLLTGQYGVPIYAQWTYGLGTVGSFMCDLNGTWSSELMNSPDGQKLVHNIVAGIMPSRDIRTVATDCVLTEGNYINNLSIFKELLEGQYVEGKVTFAAGEKKGELVMSLNELPTEDFDKTTAAGYTTLNLSSGNNFSRSSFVLKEQGVYQIELTTYNADKTVASSTVLYKVVSYSDEYDVYFSENMVLDGIENDSDIVTEDELYAAFLADLAEKGNGSLIADLENPVEVFADFITELEYEFDPRYLFMILAIILMLTDIAVRKFKFKWPHELYNEWKAKKEEEKQGN